MRGDRLREALFVWAHGEKIAGFLLVTVACALATGVAARLVRRHSPFSAGSGAAHVELVLNGDLPQTHFRLAPLKFAGGVLAIGAGLALGTEEARAQKEGLESVSGEYNSRYRHSEQ
jgi:CIC family chloride channel protein